MTFTPQQQQSHSQLTVARENVRDLESERVRERRSEKERDKFVAFPNNKRRMSFNEENHISSLTLIHFLQYMKRQNKQLPQIRAKIKRRWIILQSININLNHKLVL